jgi:hypothetical protein
MLQYTTIALSDDWMIIDEQDRNFVCLHSHHRPTSLRGDRNGCGNA